MRVAMLGESYRYAFAPVSPNGHTYITANGANYLGQDADSGPSFKVTQSVLTELVKVLPDTVRAIQGDPALTQAQKDAQLAALAKQQGISAGWFERNQTLIVGGAVILVIAAVAMSQRRGRRR